MIDQDMDRLYRYIALLIFGSIAYSCSSDNDSYLDNDNESNAINFSVTKDIVELNESRATIFETASSIFEEESGGGNFTAHAYQGRTNNCYIQGRVWYLEEGNRWWFRNGNDIYDTYWVKNGFLNFFAYMPWQLTNENSNYVTINDFEYLDGPSFTCNLPVESPNEDNMQEFIYAYSTSLHNELVNLHFVHPFAVVSFKLKQSHRDLTIHNITFEHAYNQGTYTNSYDTYNDGFVHADWVPDTSGSRNRRVVVEKIVPDDINFDAEIGGPYIVMPQSFEGDTDAEDLTIAITYSWDSYDHAVARVKLNTVGSAEDKLGWKSGVKYLYTLDLGDNQEEILFKVLVEKWEPIDYDNVIDVE